MKIQKIILSLCLLLIALASFCQSINNKFVGTYTDDVSELIIKSDNTFELKTPDYLFPYTYTVYQNHGIWNDSGNILTLNPDKEKRQLNLSLIERVIKNSDLIKIKINYLTEVYENEILVDKTPADFKLLTLYFNNTKRYKNLVHSPVRRICAFSPRLKRQMVVDSANTIKLPRQKITQLGIYTYGFEKIVELPTTNPDANYFEITIVQPIDKERMPRSKKVIIKDNYAYFYEINGEIPTSNYLLSGLKRTN